MVRVESYIDHHTDWKKPPFPYVIEAKIQVHAHKPPSPPVSLVPIQYEDVVEREEFSPLDRCLKHPPPPGEDGEGSIMLEILELVHAADGHNAQLVRVRVQPSGEEACGNGGPPPPLSGQDNVVAKFYDPLYSDHDQYESDPFKTVNSGYSFEAEAYTKMLSLQGQAIPQYYGSYTTSFAVPADSEEEEQQQLSRHVRLILIEFIQGCNMLNLNPQAYTQQQRQEIMACIIDAETAIYAKDIFLLDLYPRNVMITEDDQLAALATRSTHPMSQLRRRRVVVIDFETVYLDRHSPFHMEYFGRQHFMPGTVISPLVRWAKTSCYSRFEDWVDWDWQGWIEETYGKDRPGVTEQMKEVWGPGLA